jgi:hypothetical protein
MPIWLRNYTFNKIKEWYNQSSKNETNEDTWVKDDIKKLAINTFDNKYIEASLMPK